MTESELEKKVDVLERMLAFLTDRLIKEDVLVDYYEELLENHMNDTTPKDML